MVWKNNWNSQGRYRTIYEYILYTTPNWKLLLWKRKRQNKEKKSVVGHRFFGLRAMSYTNMYTIRIHTHNIIPRYYCRQSVKKQLLFGGMMMSKYINLQCDSENNLLSSIVRQPERKRKKTSGKNGKHRVNAAGILRGRV